MSIYGNGDPKLTKVWFKSSTLNKPICLAVSMCISKQQLDWYDYERWDIFTRKKCVCSWELTSLLDHRGLAVVVVATNSCTKSGSRSFQYSWKASLCANCAKCLTGNITRSSTTTTTKTTTRVIDIYREALSDALFRLLRRIRDTDKSIRLTSTIETKQQKQS